jgi:predicted ATPase
LAAAVPLVLVLEDLHWSDNATVGALAALAQGREPARLMVVGTYRPDEAVLRQPALRGVVQELRGHGQCEELPVELLTDEDVEAYAIQRLGGSVATTLTSHLYERTNGNALFMLARSERRGVRLLPRALYRPHGRDSVPSETAEVLSGGLMLARTR